MSRVDAVTYCFLNFIGGVCLVLGVGLGKSDIALMVASGLATSLPYPYSVIVQGGLFLIGLVLAIIAIRKLLKSVKSIVFGFLPFLSGALLISGLDRVEAWLWLLVGPVIIGVLTDTTVTDSS